VPGQPLQGSRPVGRAPGVHVRSLSIAREYSA
jgi:hypothetical protein